MRAFWLRAVGCCVSVVLCFTSACEVDSAEPSAGNSADNQLEGTTSVVAQVERANVRTFLPATLGQTAEGELQFGLTAQEYVRQGAAFAVSAAVVLAPDSTHGCDVAVLENACTNEGWLHVLPMFADNIAAMSLRHAGGFWLRGEDVVLVQVSAPVLEPEAKGRKVTVGEASDLLDDISRLAANRGTPLGVMVGPWDAVAFSPPSADGHLRLDRRGEAWAQTVGASLDPNASATGWVVRGTDGYLLQTVTAECDLSSGRGCEGWYGLNGTPLAMGMSGWAKVGAVAIVIGLIAAAFVLLSRRNRTTTITVADATGVPAELNPAATITPASVPPSVALPTTAPTPPPVEATPQIQCWPAEDKMCRYTHYQGVWYCLCLRHSALSTNDLGEECGPLNFWPGSWEDGCAILPRNVSEMGNACWFPDECPGGKKFNNDL